MSFVLQDCKLMAVPSHGGGAASLTDQIRYFWRLFAEV
jgi:hypothetical protein